jgi:hypothetical protein
MSALPRKADIPAAAMNVRFVPKHRKEAEDCRQMAAKAISPLDKEAWLKLSGDWLRLPDGGIGGKPPLSLTSTRLFAFQFLLNAPCRCVSVPALDWGLSNRVCRRLVFDSFYRSDQRSLQNVFVEILSDAESGFAEGDAVQLGRRVSREGHKTLRVLDAPR